MSELASRKQWAAKRSIAAWRGSNTGFARTSLASWSGNMRARLTVLSRMYPDALDAAITGWPQPYGGNLSVLKRFLRAAPKTLPLNECEGDCDRDSDCAEGLVCFMRFTSALIPPGCAAGGDGDIGTHDYCVQTFGPSSGEAVLCICLL